MSSLEERIAWLEAEIETLRQWVDFANGNIATPGNITQQGSREPSNPLKLYLGSDSDHGLYFFFQERPPGQGSPLWGGFETFARVNLDQPAWGYGALPLRAWGMNFLLEANGDQVGRNLVVERIYLQSPAHRNLQTGAFEKPDHYDQDGVPYDHDGNQMGGIYYDAGDLNVYLTRVGPHVVLFNHGQETVLG